MKGLKKLPCFIRLVYRVFKTKISNYFRGCKRQLNALRAYFDTISTGNKIDGTPTLRVDEQSDPEQLLIEAEEKSSAPIYDLFGKNMKMFSLELPKCEQGCWKAA